MRMLYDSAVPVLRDSETGMQSNQLVSSLRLKRHSRGLLIFNLGLRVRRN